MFKPLPHPLAHPGGLPGIGEGPVYTSQCANVALSLPFWGEHDSMSDGGPTLALVSVCGDRWDDSFLPYIQDRLKSLDENRD